MKPPNPTSRAKCLPRAVTSAPQLRLLPCLEFKSHREKKNNKPQTKPNEPSKGTKDDGDGDCDGICIFPSGGAWGPVSDKGVEARGPNSALRTPG